MSLKKCVSMMIFLITFAFVLSFLGNESPRPFQEACVIGMGILMIAAMMYGFLFIAGLHAQMFQEIECAEKEHRRPNIAKVVKEYLRWH